MYERIKTEEEGGVGDRWSAVDGVGNGDDLEMGTTEVPNPRSVSLGVVDRSFSTPVQRLKNANRLVSLDVFRGLSVAVKIPPSLSLASSPDPHPPPTASFPFPFTQRQSFSCAACPSRS